MKIDYYKLVEAAVDVAEDSKGITGTNSKITISQAHLLAELVSRAADCTFKDALRDMRGEYSSRHKGWCWF